MLLEGSNKMLKSLHDYLIRLASAWSGWRQRQRAYAELAALDDRSLADIGITRSEIPYVLSHRTQTAKRTQSGTLANANVPHAA